MSKQSDPLRITAQELPPIIIAGDSWGCGEWTKEDDPIVVHRGLEDYIVADGRLVINVSQGASDLNHAYSQIHTISCLIDSVAWSQPVKVFLFQTEVIRSITDTHQIYENLRPTVEFEHFDAESFNWILSRYYYKLSSLARTRNLKIGLIGGHSDTLFLDKFEIEYPGLFVACQSMVNLCINDSHRVDQPTLQLCWPAEMLKNLKRCCKNSTALEYLLSQTSLSKKRCWILNKYVDWFPDGVHAGRLGHKKLWLLLKNQDLI